MSHTESPDEWYERERAAFIDWWESEGQQKFSGTATLAAGAGWLARANALRSQPEERKPKSLEIKFCPACENDWVDQSKSGQIESALTTSMVENLSVASENYFKNPEQHGSGRVAESQAPTIRDGDAGVAPGLAPAAPDSKEPLK